MRKNSTTFIIIIIIICITNIILPTKITNAKTNSKSVIQDVDEEGTSSITIYTDEENLKKYGFPPNSSEANFTPQGDISLFSLPNDNPDSVTIVQPVYKVYTNQIYRDIADLFTDYIVNKIPLKITKSELGGFYASKLFGFSKYIEQTYVGSWVWETHDYNAGVHIRYATVVHYSDNTYSKPVEVALIQADRYPIEYHKSSPGEWVYYYPNYYWYEYGNPVKSAWRYAGDAWYYLKSDGVMAKGWQQISGTWYYLDPTYGYMRKDWQKIDGTWYYLDPTYGYMRTGWQQISGTWYYFYSSGAMAANTVIDGWKIDSNGVATKL